MSSSWRPGSTSAYLGSRASLLSVRDQLTLSVYWFGLNFLSGAFLPIVIPAQILLYVTPGAVGNGQQAVWLGQLSALGASATLIVQPVIGALSDRTGGTFGRRRPYVAAGTIILLAGMPALASGGAPVIFLLGFLLVQLGSSVSTASYQSLLPDRVPPEQRGAASGFMGLMTILGTIASLATAFAVLGQLSATHAPPQDIRMGATLYYSLAGIMLVAGALVTIFGVEDIPVARSVAASPGGVGDRAGRQHLVHLWLKPWRHLNFTWVFLARASVMLGLTLFMTFIEYYLANVAGVSHFVAATAAVAGLALLSAVLSALLVGILSDRTRRVPVVFAATVCMAGAALAFVIVPGGTSLWLLGALFGVGYGAYTSVDWALAVSALPSPLDAGKDMGLWSISSTLPAVIAPLMGSLVVGSAAAFHQTALGYRAVFALAVAFFLTGAILVLLVRERPP